MPTPERLHWAVVVLLRALACVCLVVHVLGLWGLKGVADALNGGPTAPFIHHMIFQAHLVSRMMLGLA